MRKRKERSEGKKEKAVAVTALLVTVILRVVFPQSVYSVYFTVAIT